MAKYYNGSAWVEREQPKDTDLADIAALTPSANDALQYKSGHWTNRTPAQLKTDLSLTKTDVGLANVDNTSDVNKPISTATQAAFDTTNGYVTSQRGGSGAVRTVRPPRPYGLDTNHSSAPSIVYSSKWKKLFMVYRQGTDHFASRDGIFKFSSSADLGRTWTAPVTIQDLTPTWDSQGQGISESRDGSKLWLVYFKATSSTYGGVFFKTSTDQGATWSTETRIDGGLNIACTTDVIIEQDDGSLLLGIYGRTTGAETQDSFYIARSTNGGTSWTVTRIKNGTTDGRAYQEPVIAVKGALAVCTFRWGNVTSIATTVSTDYGVTWSTPVARFAGTGKPHIFWATDTTLACIYRDLADGSAKIRSSRDNGTTWTPPRMVHPTYYPSGWMLYSASTKLNPSTNFIAFAEERGSPGASPGVARIYFTCASEDGGVTPFGNVPTAQDDVSGRMEEIYFSTRFEQPDGTLPAPWDPVVHNGGAAAPVTVDGAVSPSALNTNTLSRVFCNQLNDVDIEADIYSASGSGSSIGIILRMVDSGTYLLAASEDANFRLYKCVSNTFTILSGVANTHIYNQWNRHRVVARGSWIYCYYNDVLITKYDLAADAATFSSAYYHGFKLNATAGANTNHKCRRFVIRN